MGSHIITKIKEFDKQIELNKTYYPLNNLMLRKIYQSSKLLINKTKYNGPNFIKNIKSKYILKEILDNIEKKKLFEIIKYNKEIQKRIDMNINDYKKFNETFSNIEIEVIPIKNIDNNNNNNKFINIPKIDQQYYHIYFDNKRKEIKRNYITKNDKVAKIKIIINYQIKLLCGLFENCNIIESISCIKFNRNNIINMRKMFYGCSYLKNLDLSNFNTNNVINMSHMFYYCPSLKELNLSRFNTSNVIDMRNMFYYCYSLKELNLSNFNTSNVINMSYMFSGCSSLNALNLSSFNINKEVNIKFMFSKFSYKSLKNIKTNDKNIKNQVEKELNKFGVIDVLLNNFSNSFII